MWRELGRDGGDKMNEPRLYKICGSCHYFQPPAKDHSKEENELEPECLHDEDVWSEEYCELYLNKRKV